MMGESAGAKQLLTVRWVFFSYFASLLQKYKDRAQVEDVEVMYDGSHRPIVRPKVEVFAVSDSPFIRENDGAADKDMDKKPLVAREAASHLEVSHTWLPK